MNKLKFIMILAVFLMFSSAAFAFPQIMNFQGKLEDSSGTAITATTSVVFSIYTQTTEGTAVWTETLSITPNSSGIFNQILGLSTPINIDFSGEVYYMGIKVGSDAEMSPRQRLTPSAFAFNSDRLGGQQESYYINTSANTQTKSGALTLTGNLTAARLALDANTYIDSDGSSNMTFTDAISGTYTLAQLTAEATFVQSVTAGTGLTGGGSSGDITVNVGAGDGITGNANDVAVDNTVIRTTGDQTMAGNKTFSGAAAITGALTVEGTFSIQDAGDDNNAIITVADLAANRTYTIPASGADTTFVMAAGAQTISGSKTFSTGQIFSGSAAKMIDVNTTNASGYAIESTVSGANAYAISAEATGGGIAGYFGSTSDYAIDVLSTTGTAVTIESGGASPALYVLNSGSHNGIFSSVAGSTARAVHGKATSASGGNFGGYFESRSTTGTGVYGYAQSNSGVNYGVLGSTESSSGWAGYFNGGNGLFASEIHIGVSSAAVYNQIGSTLTSHAMDSSNDLMISGSLEVEGFAYLDGGSGDLAENISVNAPIAAGSVVVIDPNNDETVIISTTANDPTVAGIVSTLPSMRISAGLPDDESIPLALAGRVDCKVIDENGAIKRGDLLVSSSLPGHAMKAPDSPAAGTVIGRALSELSAGSGIIKVLVMLR